MESSGSNKSVADHIKDYGNELQKDAVFKELTDEEMWANIADKRPKRMRRNMRKYLAVAVNNSIKEKDDPLIVKSLQEVVNERFGI